MGKIDPTPNTKTVLNMTPLDFRKRAKHHVIAQYTVHYSRSTELQQGQQG